MKCTHENHVGPFRARPDMTRWLRTSLPDECVPEQYDCGSCGSTIGLGRPACSYCAGFGDVVRYRKGAPDFVTCPKCLGTGVQPAEAGRAA